MVQSPWDGAPGSSVGAVVRDGAPCGNEVHRGVRESRAQDVSRWGVSWIVTSSGFRCALPGEVGVGCHVQPGILLYCAQVSTVYAVPSMVDCCL